ncbi:MAG: T9SS type A sorting domain-containing protein [Saprospiraceae bacterium]|nr:T9SS type A sorting domain-containing protein [Saprospiraceae bacterium]
MKILIYSMLIMHVFNQNCLNAQAVIPSSVIGCGASEMSSANLKLVGSIGQTIIGLTNGSNIFNAQGFWQTYRSKVVKTTDFKLASNVEVKLVPNPLSTIGTLLIDLQEAQEFDVKIINLMGLECQQLGLRSFDSGRQSLTLDFTGLSDGIYFILLRNQNNDVKIPFVKIN